MSKMTPARPVLLAAALTAASLLVGCNTERTAIGWHANGQPVHESANRPGQFYQFVYYPQAEVYFEPYTQTYFWHEGTDWFEGTVLPSYVPIETQTPRVVKLQYPKPYLDQPRATCIFAQTHPLSDQGKLASQDQTFVAEVLAQFEDECWAQSTSSWQIYTTVDESEAWGTSEVE